MAVVVADWRRAALVDRFLRPRLAGGGPQAPPLPPLGQYLRDAGVIGLAVALQRYVHDADAGADDAGTYAAGLDGFVHDAYAYAGDPAELAAAHAPAPGPRPTWYFVSPARRHGRTYRCRVPRCEECGGAAAASAPPFGRWIIQGDDRHDEEGGGVRHVRRFYYVADFRDRRAKAEWVMSRVASPREAAAMNSCCSASCTEHLVGIEAATSKDLARIDRGIGQYSVA